MGINYLLDTNICIYICKKQPKSVLEKFETLRVGDVGMSVVTYGELFYGAHKSHTSQKTLDMLNELESYIPALPLPKKAAEYYGQIRQNLEKHGQSIGGNDLWIAAHAMALDTILVTNNEKEFTRIGLLKVENWV